MPTYDYRCDANDQVVEVRHGMSEVLNTWGELCARADREPGDTPVDAPVRRLITGGQVISSASRGEASAPACATGGCLGGMCGLD